MLRLVGAVIVLSAIAGVARAGPGMEPVRTSPASEEGPAASGSWLAWSQSAGVNPRPPLSTTHVYVRRPDGRVVRVGPPNRYAQTGGIDGHTLVLQVYDREFSRIARVDLESGHLRYYGGFVNDSGWQWRPSLSGPWLLFGRIDYGRNRYEILLANTKTHEVRRLARVSGHGAYAAPGQVNGNYAVWISCPDNACRAYRYTIGAGRTTRMPALGTPLYWHFGPSVTRSGGVYFGISTTPGRGCAAVRLVRYRAGRVTTLLSFPAGQAFQYSWADDAHRAHPRVLFDRVGCSRSALSDIYGLVDRG